MKKISLLICFFLCLTGIRAQGKQEVYYVNSFWSNWYVQTGLDMSLQNPYGHDFMGEVFPNGKSFGLNVAMGKWVTPVLGLRGRMNWENGIKLLKNGHDNWLAPFDEPGKNMEKGGYLTVVGDIQVDLHSLIWGIELIAYGICRFILVPELPITSVSLKALRWLVLVSAIHSRLMIKWAFTLMWLTIWYQVDLSGWRRIRVQGLTVMAS